MEILVNKIVSSAVQLLLFACIPFLWWMITARKRINFFHWIGLVCVNKGNRKNSLIYTTIVMILFIFVSVFILYAINGTETATSDFNGMGIKALPAAMIYSIFNTALPEELLFRGFLLKRTVHRFGFMAGNMVQSVLFGLLHGVMFFSTIGAAKTAIILLFTGGVAFAIGYINEIKSNGSIFPGWMIHAVSNLFSCFVAMFSLI